MVPNNGERIIVRTNVEGVVHYGVYVGFLSPVGHVMNSDGGEVIHFTIWKYPTGDWRTV